MKANMYVIVARAIEEGVAWGLNRAFKHTDTPTRDILEHELDTAIMNELCSVLVFDSPVADLHEET